MNFKLLAIRINEAFSLTKNLQKDILYKFSEDFVFKNKAEESLSSVKNFREIQQIEDIQSYPESLFDINDESRPSLNINIAAIVGKNGAGKSSVLEMFYLLVFCLAEKRQRLGHRVFLKQKIAEEPGVQVWPALLKNTEVLISTADLELYYQVGGEIFLLKQTPKQIRQYALGGDGWIPRKYDPHTFFYTICVNYSQYSLNASGNYYWLKPLFHKNDGYRTPIVLNPFRDTGNIDINREVYLA